MREIDQHLSISTMAGGQSGHGSMKSKEEDTLRQQWLASIGLRNFMPRDNSRVCSAHFEGGARSDKNSVPTVFSTDTIALRNIRYGQQQQQVKQEPEENEEETVSKDQVYHRQISPRKQAIPHRHPKAGPRTYGNYCCVAGCNSKWVNNPNLSFYRIPRKSKPELRRQWVEAIGSHNITSSEARVCSLHFKGGRKTELNLVPTIFPRASRLTDAAGTFQEFSNQYVNDWEKHRPMSTPQSNIETLLQASDILSQREAESRSNTPPSSSPMKDLGGDGSHLPPETPRGSSCMVPGCGNTRSNSKGRLRWYRVPKDETRRKLWLSAIGWPNAVPTDTTRICSAHFVEGVYRKKGDKAVPTIFPPKPKHWHERHPQTTEGIQPKQEMIPYVDPSSPSFSPSPSSNPSSPGVSSFQGDQQQGALPFVTRNHFEAHPYGPTMLRPEMFERSPKQQGPGESRGVTCCVARCHNNTKRSPGLRWYRIPADPTVRQLWMDFIHIARPDFAPKNHHRVCSAHFVGGMKFSKTHVPSIYDKPYNRRFLPPPNYQRPLTSQEEGGGGVEQQQQEVSQQDLGWQKQELQETHLQQSEAQEINKQKHLISGALSRQRWPRPAGDVAGPSGDAPMDLSKQSRLQNPSSPIRTRSILPLTYRDRQEQMHVKQPKQETEVLHDLSTPFNGQFNNLYPAKTSDDDLSMSGILPPGMIEPKKRVGGGSQCFVPRCTNTRRHNPGLKWYRIPKDPDLRTLWLDNIGRPDAEPKAHNRVCSDHFEGGYKQFNTSLPTIEKWSETRNHVYTGRTVIDPSSSVVGSTLLAVDSNPIAVDASTSEVTPTAAEMQSLADSLTALAAELDIAADSVDGTLPEGASTPPITSAHDYSMTSDSLTTTNSDNLPISLEASTSQTGSSSSSVATYASSPEACSVMSPLKVDTDLPESVPKMDPSNQGTADMELQSVSGGEAGSLEVGSISTPIYTSPSKHRSRHRSSSSRQENQDGPSATDANLEFTDTSLITIAGDHPPEQAHQKEGHEDQVLTDKVTDAIALEKDPEQLKDVPKLEEGNPKERVKYLEGLVQSMCEEMRLKDQRLQEKDFDLTSCRQRLEEKGAECERLKRKCLMMSVRLGSFRKLAQTDL